MRDVLLEGLLRVLASWLVMVKEDERRIDMGPWLKLKSIRKELKLKSVGKKMQLRCVAGLGATERKKGEQGGEDLFSWLREEGEDRVEGRRARAGCGGEGSVGVVVGRL
uniref:Uncharacterized protein n=1 Tax=Populus alba TaxID=43335 RepID=A0A4U5NMY5_POPAL|nr:hypothetical protein D5086_0000259630 [Populus alba]